MPIQDRSRTDRLPLDIVRQIDLLSDEFESLSKNSDTPAIAPFLTRVDELGRARLLEELTEILYERLERLGVTDPAGAILAANPDLSDQLEPLLARTASSNVEHVRENLRGSALHIDCPHCHNPIALVLDAYLEDIACPSCGSSFSLVSGEQMTKGCELGAQVSHFRLVERVGVGAFGAVWKAHDTKLDRTVAVKIPRRGQFDARQERLFIREAQNAASLNHPGIVPVHEVGRDGDTLYIVSDYVRGVTLGDWLTGHQPTARKSAELCVEIAEAIHHAHQRGVVHRDLKPTNVMIDDAGRLQLMDFGLAKRDAGEITMSMDGQVIGTPAYMSPEQAAGDSATTDCRSDVYSIGVILFRLLTGELPFRGNARMLLHQVVNDEPPSPRKLNSTVPRDLETICLKCLEKNPSRRYSTAQELAEDLRRFLDGKSIEARSPSIAERMGRFTSRHRLPVAVGLSVFFLLTGALAVTVNLYRLARTAEARAVSNESAALIAKEHASIEAKRLAQILDAVVNSFGELDPWEHGKLEDGSPAGVLLRIQDNVLNEPMADAPLAKAELLSRIGSVLCSLDHHALAIVGYERALDLQRVHLGADNESTLKTMTALACCYESKKLDKGAEDFPRKAHSLFEEAAERSLRAFGPNHIRTLRSQGMLACCLPDQEGIELMEDVVERAEKTFGADSEHTICFKHNLGVTYAQSGQYADAVRVYRQALNAIGDENNGLRLMGLGNLGSAYHALGNLDKAQEVLEDCFRISKERLGMNQPYTQNWGAGCLQGLLIDKKEFGRAEEVLREWIAAKPSIDDRDKHIAWPHVSLAAVLLEQGKTDEAGQLARQALSSPDTPAEEVARAKTILGSCLGAENNWSAGEPLLLEGALSLSNRLDRMPFAESEIPYKRFYATNACRRVIRMYESLGDTSRTAEWRSRLARDEEKIALLRGG